MEPRELIETGPFAHISTINPDGSPQVTVVWIGLDGDELVSGHMALYKQLRNIQRDPRGQRHLTGCAHPGRGGVPLGRSLPRPPRHPAYHEIGWRCT